jgi:hypothetical protein
MATELSNTPSSIVACLISVVVVAQETIWCAPAPEKIDKIQTEDTGQTQLRPTVA